MRILESSVMVSSMAKEGSLAFYQYILETMDSSIAGRLSEMGGEITKGTSPAFDMARGLPLSRLSRVASSSRFCCMEIVDHVEYSVLAEIQDSHEWMLFSVYLNAQINSQEFEVITSAMTRWQSFSPP